MWNKGDDGELFTRELHSLLDIIFIDEKDVMCIELVQRWPVFELLPVHFQIIFKYLIRHEYFSLC